MVTRFCRWVHGDAQTEDLLRRVNGMNGTEQRRAVREWRASQLIRTALIGLIGLAVVMATWGLCELILHLAKGTS